jgi:ABC-type amino acid transport substrate-binding protein
MLRHVRTYVRCLALATALAASLPITADAAPTTAGHAPKAAVIHTLHPGVLQVCLYAGFKPFAWKEGTVWKGWDVDYLAAFAKANGLAFQPVEVPEFDGIWLRPGKKECDVAGTGISDTEARRKATGTAGQWSGTYYKVVRAFLVRTADREKLKDVGDLRGKTVIVTLGSTADYDLRNRLRQAGITDVKIEGTNDEGEAAAKVRKGPQFAYGGGYGSVMDLAKDGLTGVWPHCNLVEVGKDQFKPYAEPFAFVARTESTGVLAAVNAYIPRHKYAGTPNPPGVICPEPPWAGK